MKNIIEFAGELNAVIEQHCQDQNTIEMLILALYAAQKQLSFEPLPLAELSPQEKADLHEAFMLRQIRYRYSTDGKKRSIEIVNNATDKQARFD